MIGVSLAGAKIMVATQPVDFRRGMIGPVTLVAPAPATNPYCSDVFVFRLRGNHCGGGRLSSFPRLVGGSAAGPFDIVWRRAGIG